MVVKEYIENKVGENDVIKIWMDEMNGIQWIKKIKKNL